MLESKGLKMKEGTMSRVYHTMANLKQDVAIAPKDRQYLNEAGIWCKRTNAYQQLFSQEIDEIVKLEEIAHKVSELSSSLNFKMTNLEK